MDFDEPEIYRHIEKTVDRFLEQEISPLEDEYSHFLGEDSEQHIIEGAGPDYRMCDEYVSMWEEIRERSAEAGIWTMHMPEEVGGGGLDALPFTMLIEYIENRNPDGFHTLIWDIGTVNEIMLPAYDDDFQRKEYFEPMMNGAISGFGLTEPGCGSDATAMQTTAEKEGDEWVINGSKAFISKAAVADFLMVHARTSGEPGDVSGISTFFVDPDNPGLSIDKIQRSMGGQPGRQTMLSFDDCHVPKRDVLGEVDEGFEQLIEWIGAGRLTIPAKAVGRAEWMLDRSIEYTNQREAFGSAIGDYQGIQFQLADAATDIEQVRWLYRHAAWKYDQGYDAVKEQSMAKLRGSQLWNDVADMAIQVHGGSGFMRSLPFESEYREARASRIYEGTDEIQKRTIARKLL